MSRPRAENITSRVETIDANHGFREGKVSVRNRYNLGTFFSQVL